MSRQLRLGAFMRPTTIHTGEWRYSGAYPDANFKFKHLKEFAQTLERGRFDAFFMADHLAVLNMPIDALKHSHTVTSFETLTLLPALAAVTEKLGLVATASPPSMRLIMSRGASHRSITSAADGQAGTSSRRPIPMPR